ncbi:MAG: ATP-dependent DNA helicase [Deltaproteobacteria bacterium]|nr:ATP-dependent DNA helicase [Deltaproteobacteria bacterium]
MSLERRIIEVLGPDGVLDRDWPAFEERPGQLEMALAVGRALQSQGRAVVEAGTGTGKTLAYLVPVILSGMKTIISTATKNLQDQIMVKDLPGLSRFLAGEVEACLVKGRLNYLCRRRLAASLGQGRIEAYLGRKLQAWVEVSPSGDRAEVDFLAESDPLWALLTTASDGCLGQECGFFDDCFITRLRRRASAARLVVVNHHLFMADLALRQGGFGQVLPESEAVVFDEAHELEEAATAHFSVAVSNLRLESLIHDLAATRPGGGSKTVGQLAAAAEEFFRAIPRPGERFPLTDELLTPDLLSRGERLTGLLLLVAERTGAEIKDSGEAAALAQRARSAADDLRMIIGRLEPDYVYFGERLRRGLTLKAAPVAVADILGRALFRKSRAFVFTSATLDPAHLRERLGLGRGVEELTFPSPFDFAAQSRLYVPAQMPLPQAPEFPAAVADQMEALVKISQGRAFLLFTSHRNLEAVFGLLAPRLGFPVLKQGQAPKAVLVEEFLRREGSVLLATASFWQGVDVPGPALSLVAIDKLPFAPPDDPLVVARAERLRALGLDPFHQYQLPEAILSLRQGLGRLIRSSQDAGLLAVLDIRLFSKSYGRVILEALPESPVIRDLGEVARWSRKRL